MNASEMRKKLAAAQTMLLEETTTRQKFSSIRTLLQGISPAIDGHLSVLEKHLSTWDKVESGDVIMLSAENLPEHTEEQKKRKKMLLFFLNSWRQLGGEVERVKAEMATQAESGVTSQISMWGKILKHAKGPIGLVTIVAVGLVYMQQTSVHIAIENRGCATMHPSTSFPISIPGLKLPSEPLVSGDSVVATLPGLTVHVDGTTRGTLQMKILTYSLSFQLPGNVRDVTLDGASLLNKQADVKLSEKDSHTLTLRCG